jgi:uncharacterized protein YkwD
MSHPLRTIAVLCLVVLSLGGCPQTFTTGDLGSIIPGGAGGADAGDQLDALVQAGRPAEFPECTEPATADEWRAQVLDLVNQERRNAGLNPVTYNSLLESQADQYACELIHYGFFDHVNPVTGSTLGDRAKEFGYEFAMVGENLAAGQRTPAEAVRDWMDSPGHRRNILEPEFTELGVGIRIGGQYGFYWVQEFGKPRSNGTARVTATAAVAP